MVSEEAGGGGKEDDGDEDEGRSAIRVCEGFAMKLCEGSH